MANYNDLKTAIQQVIRTNGNEEITGALLQQSLLSMIDSLGAGYQFMGVATPSTNPGTPDQKVFYIANGKGVYTNFGGIEVTEDEAIILYYDTIWHKETTGIEKISISKNTQTGGFDLNVGGTPVANISNQAEHNANDEILKILDLSMAEINELTNKPYGLYGIGARPSFTANNGLILRVCNTRLLSGEYDFNVNIRDNSDNVIASFAYDISDENGLISIEKNGIIIIIDCAAAKSMTYSMFNVINLPINIDALKATWVSKTLVEMVGADGTHAGSAGLVPAPAATDNEKFLRGDGTYQEIVIPETDKTELFLDSTQVVTSLSTRSKTFDIDAAGKNAIIVVSFISGVSTETFNLSWVDGEGVSTSIATGIPMGKYSQVLSVPNDAVKLKVFIGNTDTPSTYSVRMYNADGTRWFIDQMNETGALPYLNNRRVYIFDYDAQVSESLNYILTEKQGDKMNLSGEIYAAIFTDAEFVSEGYFQGGIKFYSKAGSEILVYGDELKSGKLFKIFTNQTLNRISIPSGSIESAGHIRLIVFSAEISNEYLSRPLKNSHILCFGDSNTQFKHPATRKRYSDYLSDISGAIVYNCGVGGTRLAQRQTPSLTPAENQQALAAFEIVSLIQAFASNDYSLQVAALNSGLLTSSQQNTCEAVYNTLSTISIKDIDIITINGGSNDYHGGNTIGEETISNNDTTTTIGAINVIVKVLLTAKPTLKLYFFEPIFGMEGDEVTWENSSDYYIPEDAPEGLARPAWNTLLKEAVQRNHIPYDDWYYTLGFNIYTFSTYYTDNHHAQHGYHIMAEKMYKFLLSN